MAIFNPNNTQPFNLNSLKPKNTTTPLSGSLSSTAAKNYISSLTAGGSSKMPVNNVAKQNPVVSSNLSATSPTIVKPTTPTMQVAGTTQNNSIQTETPIAPPQNNPITTTPTAENPRDAYVKYLSQYLAPTQQESDSRMNLAKIQNEEQARQTELRRQQESTQDQSGGLRSGAIEASNQIGVRGNRELADIALRKGAEANLLSALTGNREAGFKGAQPLQFGNDYIDPITGKTIYSKPDAGVSLGTGETYFTKDPLTGEYKQVAAGAPKETTVKNDSAELLSPAEALTLGVPYGTTKGQAYGTQPQKSLTEGESKARQYGATAKQANDSLATMTYTPSLLQVPLPNRLKSEERQMFENSARAFVNSVLRRESGATITDDEFTNKYKELIPAPGEGEKVLAQKKALRDLAVKSTIEAGQAFNSPTSQSQTGGTSWADL